MKNQTYLGYRQACQGLSFLLCADPPLDTPAGQLLSDLADAIEKYEKVMFPFPTPSEPELRAFREREAKGE